MSVLSDRIKEARQRAALTQQQLADALGVTRQEIGRWEGGVKPGRDMLLAIGDALGICLAAHAGRGKKLKEEDAKESDRYVQTLCYYRKAKGMTVQQLASASGVSDSVISGIENGKLACADPWVKPLARALGCRVDDIYSGAAGAKEYQGDLPASEWSGATTVKAIKGAGVCAWCGKEHTGFACSL